MAFCSYSKDYANSNFTGIENQFITKYLPIAEGESVKVYLYGLFLCQNSTEEFTLEEMSKSLNLPEENIVNAFKYWEEFDLVQILSFEPFTVQFLPADFSKGKPKKFNPEKYSDFCKAIQSLKPNTFITTTEYSEYFQTMEQYSIKPDAMIMIAKYCIDCKGPTVSFKYIIKVAQNFASEGITTPSKVEEKLSDYVMHSSDIAKVLSALGSNKKPDVADIGLLKRWTNTLTFEIDTIVFIAKKLKGSSMQKLDTTITELYANKRFDNKEIAEYLKDKNTILSLTTTVAKELGVFVENLEECAYKYISNWLARGYSDIEIITLAKFEWKRRKRSFVELDELIEKLYSQGIVSMESITEFMNVQAGNDRYIAKLLSILGLTRKPNPWDRESLKNWRSWNFSDEMIEEAAKRATNATSPIPYMNSILSSWKSKNIFSVDQLVEDKPIQKGTTNQSGSSKPQKKNEFVSNDNSREYSKQTFDEIIDSWNDIEI